MVSCCGVRGATSVPKNSEAEILQATRTLLEKMVKENEISTEAIAGVFFTATQDLNAVHPAQAARDLGWRQTALLCAQAIDVPASLPRCVRVLMFVNMDRTPDRIRHVYLGDARSLRPDWVKEAGE